MAIAETSEDLLPSLLDRLLDEDPDNQMPESIESRTLTTEQLRNAVMEDLRNLLNTISWPENEIAALPPRARPSWRPQSRINYLSPVDYPEAANSVINFGVPPIYDFWESDKGLRHLQESIAKAIERFEPRITLKPDGVTPLGRPTTEARPSIVAIRIEGTLWAQPAPLELVLRSDMDIERREATLRVMEGSR